ncbi:MAG: nuclear transport factor 2 family protein [Acidobacteria bacterium]|nr:nuclear transport factor 2 family protein [Acidobacteriota bacterium]
MNKLLLPAALLLCAAACAPAPTNSTNTNANAANTNAANANSAAAATWTDADVIAGDRAAWDAIKRKDWTAFPDMLAPEFVDVGSDGVLDKDGTVAYVKKFDLTEATLSDFKVIKIDNDAAITVYTVTSKGTIDGKPIPADSKMYHSTVKVLRGGKWLAVFHQGTPSMPAAPTPAATASASPAASAAATPAASPAAATSDVEANERLIWDALKRKDWNAFAGYLAEDQLEVGGMGVNTKAMSVKGVQGWDFSDAVLSGLKTVPIDADAKIVTYTVKGTGPDKKPFTEHSSSVWANRGGKWLAVFHQSTPTM